MYSDGANCNFVSKMRGVCRVALLRGVHKVFQYTESRAKVFCIDYSKLMAHELCLLLVKSFNQIFFVKLRKKKNQNLQFYVLIERAPPPLQLLDKIHFSFLIFAMFLFQSFISSCPELFAYLLDFSEVFLILFQPEWFVFTSAVIVNASFQGNQQKQCLMFAIPVGLSDTETSYFLTDFFNIAISSFAAFRLSFLIALLLWGLVSSVLPKQEKVNN